MNHDGVLFETVFRHRPSNHPARCAFRFHPVFLVLLLGLCFIAAPRPARADFRVCNATKQLVGVAIGYRASAGWTTEGWWQIPGSSCATLIKGRLSSRYYYLYAEDAGRGGRWGGKIDMCVADNEFKIVGVHNCFARGFERMGFKEYDTGRQGSWMVKLTGSPSDSNSKPADGEGKPDNAGNTSKDKQGGKESPD